MTARLARRDPVAERESGALPRVLVLIDTLKVGGPARLVASLASGLRARGVDIRVAHLGIGDSTVFAAELQGGGVPVLNLGPAALLDPRPIRWLAGYLGREHIDVLHTHNRYAHLVGRAAATLAGRPGVTSIHYLVDEDVGWRGAARRWLDEQSLRLRGDRVVCVSQAQASVIQRSMRLPRSTIEVHRSGIDTRRFRPDAAARTLVRAELGLDDATPLFLGVAMLRPNKGLDVLLEAAALLRSTAPEARFAVVGEGVERASLEARRAVLGVEDQVRFLGIRTDVERVLAAADVYVHPSRFEALSTSVLEAMAVGLPVVATEVGGLPEIVFPGRTGLLVPPGDARALAAAMGSLLDPAMRSTLGAAGRDWAERNASLDRWLDGHLDLYRRVGARRVKAGER